MIEGIGAVAVTDLTVMLRRGETNGRPVLMGGVHDALTARIARECGFAAAWLSGLCVTASHAVRDDGSLPIDEYLERTREITRAVSIPLLVDGEHGFGDAARSTALFCESGAAGLCLEDQAGPKRNSFHGNGADVLTADSGARLINSARRAIGSEPFTIVARTEALLSGEDLQSVLDRLARYVDAGADAVIVHSCDPSGRDVLDVATQYKGPVPMGVIPTRFYGLSSARLGDAGVRFVIYANQGLRAMIAAYQWCCESVVRLGSGEAIEHEIVPLEEVFRLQGSSEVPEKQVIRTTRTIASSVNL